MIDKKKILLALLTGVAFCVPARAQQNPIYSQYMFNGLVLNPAYASLDESASITAVGRNQWVGVDGAPKTATLSFYTPLNEKGTSVGFSAMKETITVQSRTDFNLLASQKVSLSETFQLAMGLQAGMSQYQERNSELTTTDPTFAANQSYWKTNVGFGFALFSENFYLGLSAPTFKSFDLGNSVNKVVTKSHYYLQAAYAYHINDDVLIKPSVLLRQVQGSGLNYDINTSVLLRDVVWLGASWRSEKTVTGLVQVRLTPVLELGYSYDTPMSSNLKGAQTVSHELMLRFRFGWSFDHEVAPKIF
ncbi:PorP/SprF family type IX secretion system membrane protein [Chitinophaga tropicalis]|uniref:Type IX secretion system membrane protein PorP/SprF n=1 Tax=Chitinophaga tropicalis TaxID=2683588 RepID=A0A7K1U6Z8_9BACT|nr:type IX secretion system membrane protein PorP/SprF [Chitinophaga tropicalis]MVT10066.1 type IX secretion system membrane protein PorP/SprF [Chitinophaga tropicalis]